MADADSSSNRNTVCNYHAVISYRVEEMSEKINNMKNEFLSLNRNIIELHNEFSTRMSKIEVTVDKLETSYNKGQDSSRSLKVGLIIAIPSILIGISGIALTIIRMFMEN